MLMHQDKPLKKRLSACLHEGGGPYISEVTCLGGVKK